MTTAVHELLVHFEQLSQEEQREAAREILHRAAQASTLPLTDDELTSLADECFLELDRREAGQ